jgi:hypothetical protein
LVFSGCATKEIKPPEKIVIEKVYVYEKCVKSVHPTYKKLEPNSHIGSAYNVNILLENLTFMEDYVKSLESIISCYENQSKGTEQ